MTADLIRDNTTMFEALELIAKDERTYLGHGDYTEAPLPGAECQRIARETMDRIDAARFNIPHPKISPLALAQFIEDMAENPKGGKMAAIAYKHAARLIRERCDAVLFARSDAGRPANDRYRHKKRGSVVELLHEAIELQSAGGPIEEGASLVIYRHIDDGRVWARPAAEFHDGRFEPARPDAETKP